MRRIATTAAVVALLVLAAIGLASGVPPFVVSLRALVGAAVTYVLVTIAGRVLVRILVDLMRTRPRPGNSSEEHLR
jgi:hypothetical protein